MERETNEQIRNRLEGMNVPTVERYASVGLGVAAAGAGITAALLGPRRLGVAGIAVAAAGLALIARGVSGRCPLTRMRARRLSHAGDQTMFTGANQGEGDRRAARAYSEYVRDFIEDDRVEPAARAAADAIDGPEGPSLRAAEEAGKAPQKPGPS